MYFDIYIKINVHMVYNVRHRDRAQEYDLSYPQPSLQHVDSPFQLASPKDVPSQTLLARCFINKSAKGQSVDG